MEYFYDNYVIFFRIKYKHSAVPHQTCATSWAYFISPATQSNRLEFYQYISEITCYTFN